MVEEHTNLDNGPRVISKYFHNKISTGAYQLTKSFSQLFDPRLLLTILGPLGIILLLFSLSKLKTGKKEQIATATVILLSILLLYKTNPLLIYTRILSLQLLALNGLVTISKIKYSQLALTALVFITFIYFSFSWQMPELCHAIFFK